VFTPLSKLTVSVNSSPTDTWLGAETSREASSTPGTADSGSAALVPELGENAIEKARPVSLPISTTSLSLTDWTVIAVKRIVGADKVHAVVASQDGVADPPTQNLADIFEWRRLGERVCGPRYR